MNPLGVEGDSRIDVQLSGDPWSVRCPACGIENLPLAPQCLKCGAELTIAAPRPNDGLSKWAMAIVVPLLIAIGGLGGMAFVSLRGTAASASASADTALATARPASAAARGEFATPTPSSSAPSPTPLGTGIPRAAPKATPAPARLIQLPKLSIKVWRATVRYYGISGKDPNKLIASAERNIPGDGEGDRHADAMAYVEANMDELEPTYVANAYGSCVMTGVTGKVTYRVTAPRWTKPSRVHPALLRWWKDVLEHIRWHEEQHVRIFERWIDKLDVRLSGQPCSKGQSIINRWTGDVVNAQKAFDAKERDWGKAYPYKGPWDW
jgi:predicted secreted Zn-dependent protease